MEIRSAEPTDAALISSHRRSMFVEIGSTCDTVLAEMEQASISWTERMIRAGRYLGWIAMDAGYPIASAGMLILDWPPHPLDPQGEERAYLLNVFVEPSYRKRGLARRLVQLSMEEARRRTIRVITLHASDAGRPVYESLSFRTTNEMMHTTLA